MKFIGQTLLLAAIMNTIAPALYAEDRALSNGIVKGGYFAVSADAGTFEIQVPTAPSSGLRREIIVIRELLNITAIPQMGSSERLWPTIALYCNGEAAPRDSARAYGNQRTGTLRLAIKAEIANPTDPTKNCTSISITKSAENITYDTANSKMYWYVLTEQELPNL